MQRILVQNHLYLLEKYDFFRSSSILYAPVFFSQVQRAFFEKRFSELKKRFPLAQWCESLEDKDFDVALSLDAIFETNAFGVRIFPEQNRLFSRLSFSLPKTFTPFKDLAFEHLPDFFTDALTPWDSEVRKDLDYYFREKKLPSTYLETRNQMTGRDGSTKFSAWLSSGALDVKHLYNEVRTFERLHGETKSSRWILYELLWREFFYWNYHEDPRAYFSKNGLKGPYDFSPVPCFTLEKLRGMSDTPFFQAALSELTTTGFLSNRARQMFASFWINDLGLDWRSGAELFQEHLIDFDVYSNFGNWMYLAGVGVDPRGKRYFNINKQLETYDPQGLYLKTAAPST